MRKGTELLAWSEGLNKRASWALLLSTHLLSVLFSRGYFQFDEHYQVLEFIQWKLGLIASAQMPWELETRMRPWLHPLLFFPLEWLSDRALGWSPFIKTTLHRGCVAAFVLCVIARRTRRRPQLLALYASLFFFPFIDVRISAEVIGGWLFALGYALDDERGASPRPLWSFGCGFLFGLAAVIRFHVLALLFGLLLFHLRKRELRRCVWLGLGVLPALGLGVLCDRWGYGAFTYAPWNYVYQNIVLGKAVHFGSGASPWYWYLRALLEKTCYLPGAVFIAALGWQWLRRPLDKLSFISVPFVLLHVAVAHKELRFLFPLAPFVPDLVLGLWQDVRTFRPARYFGILFIALNLILLTPAALHDADADVGLYAALYANPPAPGSVLHYVNNTNPISPYHLHPSYYLGTLGLEARPLNPARKPGHGLSFFDGEPAYAALRDEARCDLVASRYPRFVLDHWPSWLPPKPWLKLWSLWRCP
jgi:phosphatidylinositol glycan class B